MKVLNKISIPANPNKSIKKQICFHGNENTDSQIKESRHESTGSWLGKGIASFMIPGLGQFIDERKKIGFIHLGIDISLFALGAIFSKKLISDITIKHKANTNSFMLIMLAVFGQGIMRIISGIESLMNSGKNKKDN